MTLRLRERYALMLASAALAASAVVTIIFLHVAEINRNRMSEASAAISQHHMMKQLEGRGRGLLIMMSSALVNPLYKEDFETLYNLLSSVRNLPDVRDILVYDAGGAILHDGTPTIQSFGAMAAADIRDRVIAKGEWLVVSKDKQTRVAAPIKIGQRILGAVELTLNHDRINAAIDSHNAALEEIADQNYDRLLRMAVVSISVALLISMVVGAFAARRLSRPIEELRETVHGIAEGRPNLVWPSPKDEELRELSEGLKAMVRDLRAKTVSTAYLDDIIGNMFDCLVVTDTRQRIEKVNPATCALTEYAAHELINQPLSIFLMPPEARSSAIDAAIDSKRIDNIYTKSGRAIPVLWGSSSMASHVDGQPRTVSLFRDISGIRAYEAQLRAAREEAEVANAAKSRFLANMSHELRTPLNAIIGFSAMIKDQMRGPMPDGYMGYAVDIHESAEHLLAIINDILDISKLEAGKMELMEEEVAVEEMLSLVLRIIRQRADERGIAVELVLKETIPDLLVDARMLKQILINILSNAVKFNIDEGRVTLTAGRRLNGDVYFAVRDTGIGMDPADIPRLLEPFAQASAAHSRSHQGTGLGLAIAKSMVTLHGGALTVDSAVNAGTTVTVTLPAERLLIRADKRSERSESARQ